MSSEVNANAVKSTYTVQGGKPSAVSRAWRADGADVTASEAVRCASPLSLAFFCAGLSFFFLSECGSRRRLRLASPSISSIV